MAKSAPTPAQKGERAAVLAGQSHLIEQLDRLSGPARENLARQVESLDFAGLRDLIDKYVLTRPVEAIPGTIGPPPVYSRSGAGADGAWDVRRYFAAGEGVIRAGKVAAFTVAGGQGSRLGYAGPKGCVEATPVLGKTLFQVFAEGIASASARYSAPIPWYIMTSPQNHAETLDFFERHGWFGLAGRVMLFPQGQMPTFDAATGRILLAGASELLLNPDGHGGSIAALHKSGALGDMRARGVEHISYFQVDNPLVNVIDPLFVGLHAAGPKSSGEMSSKMVPKAYPEEKLGVFCGVGGRTRVIEYSDFPAELARERKPDGTLLYSAGSIAIHMMSVEFVSRLASDPAFSLPFHRADKSAAYFDPSLGKAVQPAGANAVKLERFVFDALPLCESSVVLEAAREDEFAPIKNATGVDSIESSRAMQVDRAARWLESAGVRVARGSDGQADCIIEISPITAVAAEDLRSRSLPREIERGASVAI